MKMWNIRFIQWRQKHYEKLYVCLHDNIVKMYLYQIYGLKMDVMN
jgi:hypothetical protein